MTNLQWLMQLSLIAFCVFVLSSVLLSLLYPLYKNVLSKAPWYFTHTLSLYYSVLPLLIALSSSLIVSVPHFSSRLVLEHCHQGNCEAHVSSIQTYGVFGIAFSSIMISILVIFTFVLCNSLMSTRRKLKVLDLLARRQQSAFKKIEYHVVESRDVFAWCVGLLRPQIYVSSAMLQNTSSQQQKMFLAHEQCHKQDKHNLQKCLLHCLSIFWLPKAKANLKADFSDWLEHYANQYALAYLDKQPIKQQNKSHYAMHTALLSCALASLVFGFSSASHFLIEFSNLS